MSDENPISTAISLERLRDLHKKSTATTPRDSVSSVLPLLPIRILADLLINFLPLDYFVQNDAKEYYSSYHHKNTEQSFVKVVNKLYLRNNKP